jgi:putative component of membrane protein insertase Oxa1/YidC/SpoIIIJ protein YidD
LPISIEPRKGLLTLSCLLLLLALLLAASAKAQAAPPLEAAGALDFARSLLAEGDGFAAAGECRRFLNFFPDDPRAGEARRLLAQAAETARRSPQSGPPDFIHGRSVPAPAFSPAYALVRFYQTRLWTFKLSGLAAFQVPTSASYPPTSRYALEAIARHGDLMGAFMTVDRLMRNVTHINQPPFVYSRGRRLHYDPVEANDYWWASRQK